MFIRSITVQGDHDTAYVVTPIPDGGVHCTCPAWRFGTAPVETRTCKHVVFVANAFGVSA